jgi:hypothetical protein
VDLDLNSLENYPYSIWDIYKNNNILSFASINVDVLASPAIMRTVLKTHTSVLLRNTSRWIPHILNKHIGHDTVLILCLSCRNIPLIHRHLYFELNTKIIQLSLDLPLNTTYTQ